MSDSIRVENVSKEYRLGKANQETMLRERLSGLLNPFAKDTRVEEILLALKDVSFSTKEGEVVGIIEMFRASLFPQRHLDLQLVAISLVTTFLVFAIGAVYFRNSEKTFADII